MNTRAESEIIPNSVFKKMNLINLYKDYTRRPEWEHQNHDRIARTAYFKSMARGFQPGHEMEDWIEAKKEVSEKLMPHEFFI